ncbi:MAG: sulfurtransferase [Saprospiraceae bacterium]
MKYIKNFTLLVFFIAISTINAFSQATAAQTAPGKDFIITAKDFKNAVKSDQNIVIIDAGKPKDYPVNHLKNAMYILYDDLNIDNPEVPLGTIQTPEFIGEYFGKKGITADDNIVIYDDGSQKYSSRMYVLFKYVGANNVKLLHKDIDEWGKERLPLTTQVPKEREPATFVVNTNNDFFVDLDYVMKNKDNPNVVLVDVRSPEEYTGVKKVVDGKFGHIPGSINIPYEEFETASGAFKTKAQLQELADKYGLSNDKEIVFFCKTGVKGSVAYIAFDNILGHPNAKLYDGGCADYCSKYELVK